MEMVNGKIGFLEFFYSGEENIDGSLRLFELICRGVMGLSSGFSKVLQWSDCIFEGLKSKGRGQWVRTSTKILSLLVIFVAGVILGLATSSHINHYFTSQAQLFLTNNIASAKLSDNNCTVVKPREKDLCHLLPLWERFFRGHDQYFSIYVHNPHDYVLNVSSDSPFYGRMIPSKDVEWGSVSLVDAEKRLLANALLDFSNERFVLLSESCIPIYNFPTVYKYLIRSEYSFVESYDEPSRYGRGRYSRKMLPDIHLYQWRKGSQWFEIQRDLAVYIVSDTKYYTIFKKYCRPACYPDEHFIPTYLNMFHGSLNSNRSVTWSIGPSEDRTQQHTVVVILPKTLYSPFGIMAHNVPIIQK
ncbi:hypothetical protein D5086_005933 [Populus alba]|uniref:Uncharacterized protein n=1 Tax=Populus alba TaxID=43335 RepID=A0ACC4CJN3_POPAL